MGVIGTSRAITGGKIWPFGPLDRGHSCGSADSLLQQVTLTEVTLPAMFPVNTIQSAEIRGLKRPDRRWLWMVTRRNQRNTKTAYIAVFMSCISTKATNK